MNWQKLIAYVLGGMVIFFLGYLTHSALVPTPKNETTRSNNVNIARQEIGLVAKDSGKIAPKIRRITKPDSSSTPEVVPTEAKRDSIVNLDTLRTGTKIATDSLSFKGKKYPIEYNIEVPHKGINYSDGSYSWVARAIIKLGLPVISEESLTNSKETVSKPVYVTLPFFLNPYFYSSVVLVVITALAIIF
jgi:hypothetical protein